ncbi:flagellar basal body-associated protein FliL [Photobacterium galatheae]|uniref:Flagellar protein FliL n=1 Tax=Photobacterium galatheae TaxID=1654360 RepID=A0A066RXD1_9GAMM|nr:flagellar basal body-associated protein FliL [Photobacterium galatheae]KDM92347.1 flagellar basal body-associated protein FliL-like protein [Photobacterium galatheae]MCM0150858.1 flagellar basal body-associated protein FliL [Photobacterium galatheae]
MKSLLLTFAVLLLTLNQPAFAQAAQGTPQYSYFTLTPDITTNYTTQGNKLGYLRLQVDLMVADPDYLPLVEHHAPLIRDAIIQIISEQPEVKIKSLAGREAIRQQCLTKVNDLLIAETNQKLLTELLFTKYLYQ